MHWFFISARVYSFVHIIHSYTVSGPLIHLYIHSFTSFICSFIRPQSFNQELKYSLKHGCIHSLVPYNFHFFICINAHLHISLWFTIFHCLITHNHNHNHFIHPFIHSSHLWHIDGHFSHGAGFNLSHGQSEVRGRDLYSVNQVIVRDAWSGGEHSS